MNVGDLISHQVAQISLTIRQTHILSTVDRTRPCVQIIKSQVNGVKIREERKCRKISIKQKAKCLFHTLSTKEIIKKYSKNIPTVHKLNKILSTRKAFEYYTNILKKIQNNCFAQNTSKLVLINLLKMVTTLFS